MKLFIPAKMETVSCAEFLVAKFDADGKIFEMLESNVDITQRIEMQA